MTRKHFEAIAQALRVNRGWAGIDAEELIDVIADDLAAALRQFNPAFDKEEFLAATKRRV